MGFGNGRDSRHPWTRYGACEPSRARTEPTRARPRFHREWALRKGHYHADRRERHHARARNLAPAVARFGDWLHLIDRTALGVFAIELLLRFFVYRRRFFHDPWRVFDFGVVGIALMPTSGAFSVLRALRVLRVLRLVSLVPSMRGVVGALLAALPGWPRSSA